MERVIFQEFETKSAGFLHEIAVQESGAPDTLMLTAAYDESRFEDTLFARLNIPCPPNIKRAVVKRKADYLAGRALTQVAMATLGMTPQPISSTDTRAPIWPPGVTGSISHARGQCASILSRNTGLSLGVDTEAIAKAKSLTAILSETVNTAEQAHLTESPWPKAVGATLTFSAKEALFKALHPQVQRFFGFDAAELCTPPQSNTLTLALTTKLTPKLRKGQRFTINIKVSDTHVLTWLGVPTP